jgi:hypothetical protein
VSGFSTAAAEHGPAQGPHRRGAVPSTTGRSPGIGRSSTMGRSSMAAAPSTGPLASQGPGQEPRVGAERGQLINGRRVPVIEEMPIPAALSTSSCARAARTGPRRAQAAARRAGPGRAALLDGCGALSAEHEHERGQLWVGPGPCAPLEHRPPCFVTAAGGCNQNIAAFPMPPAAPVTIRSSLPSSIAFSPMPTRIRPTTTSPTRIHRLALVSHEKKSPSCASPVPLTHTQKR